MNKSILLGAFVLCLSLTSKAQIYRNGVDMYVYPTTSSQIENYDGMSGLVSFATVSGNIADRKFSLYEHKGNVSHMTLSHFVETEKWDEKVWSESESNSIYFKNGAIIQDGASYELLLGKPQLSDYFSLLNSKGADEKECTQIHATYIRDDEGRVDKITIHENYYNKLAGMFRYSYIGFSDRISSIEWYDGNAKLTIIVKYEWEDERLARASWSHLTDGTKPSKSYAYSYDAHNNVTKINYFEQFTGKYKYGEATSVTYSFQYEYNDDLIQRCNCTYGSNYNIDWTFKYDSKGNWTEMIVKDYDYTRKVKRDIFYK